MTVRVRVKLPKIGMTMEEATIVRFCRQPGEAFSKGDPLYEIETEKISQEFVATGDGVMVAADVQAVADLLRDAGQDLVILYGDRILQGPRADHAARGLRRRLGRSLFERLAGAGRDCGLGPGRRGRL